MLALNVHIQLRYLLLKLASIYMSSIIQRKQLPVLTNIAQKSDKMSKKSKTQVHIKCDVLDGFSVIFSACLQCYLRKVEMIWFSLWRNNMTVMRVQFKIKILNLRSHIYIILSNSYAAFVHYITNIIYYQVTSIYLHICTYLIFCS